RRHLERPVTPVSPPSRSNSRGKIWQNTVRRPGYPSAAQFAPLLASHVASHSLRIDPPQLDPPGSAAWVAGLLLPFQACWELPDMHMTFVGNILPGWQVHP